jgi:hypothetical protein
LERDGITIMEIGIMIGLASLSLIEEGSWEAPIEAADSCQRCK